MSSLNLYKSYNFVDKDPVIDLMRSISERQEIGIPRISAISGVSEGTIRNWFFGKTKRPQYATVAAVMSAMGYRANWMPDPLSSTMTAHAQVDQFMEMINRRHPLS